MTMDRRTARTLMRTESNHPARPRCRARVLAGAIARGHTNERDTDAEPSGRAAPSLGMLRP